MAIVPATLTSPANGSVLPGSLVTFQWTPGAGVTDYWLCVSSVAAGQCEIYNIDQNTLDQGPTYSHTLAGLPTDGRPIYVRLSSEDPATNWYSVDYTFVAAGGSFVPAAITSPASGTDLTASSATFQWTAGANVSDRWLYISNVRPGGSELYNAEQGAATSRTVSGLPTDGSTLYVRLASLNASTNTWFNIDYTYVASGAFQPATLLFPASGSTFTSSTAIFQWSPGVLVSDYWLYVSNTAAGNGELYSADQGTGTLRAVTGLPVNGSPIYVRVASKNAITGLWTNQDYVYTAFTSTGNAVTFVGTDWQTEGDWNGVYGQDGNVIAQSSTAPPSYSGWNPMSTTNLGYYADFSTDPRGPVQPKYNFDSGSRLIAHFYNRYYMEFQVNTTDRQSHRLALYFSDWQPAQPLQAFPLKRSITIHVRDTDSGAILDTRILSDYTAGVYLVYNYVGNITFHIENNYPPVNTDGVTRDLPNGTVTAFFWGGQGLPPQNGSPAALSISSSHTGNFTQGQTGAYHLTVSNSAAAGATTKPVTVTERVPSGLTLVSLAGAGWTCSGATCTRADSLPAGASYGAITATVSVAPNAPSPQVNTAFVSGGTSPVAAAADNTVINPNPPVLSIAKTHSGNFQQGQTGATYTVTVSNAAGAGATNSAVTVTEAPPSGLTLVSMAGSGWSCSGVTCTRADSLSGGASYPAITVTVNVAANAPTSLSNSVSLSGGGSAAANAADNTTIVPTQGLRFVPVTPCRAVDTRNPTGPFGGPQLAGGASRDFTLPNSACGIPSTALAYSLNVAAVPAGLLGYLTLWPSGQTQPVASTLNSLDGRVKSNAAIIPAGAGGAISVFASNATHVILDVDGYFVANTDPSALAFFPVAPCRIADTRSASAPLGGPSLTAGQTRAFPVLSSACNIPATAQAYSLNLAAVPKGPLGYLTAWGAGQSQPGVSTLNAPTGTVTANAAIVPAGSAGAIDIFASNATDLVIDINGYFAPMTTGGLSLYPVTPCRTLDTRQPAGSQPISGAHNVLVSAQACGISPSAQAYIFGATVVPPGALGYLTLWPQGQTQPNVAALNAVDGAVTSNLAIVPSSNGSISVFPSNPTHLILDIFGYFAP
jgi:uncharacterized repeat protein (TIGR01451 family)